METAKKVFGKIHTSMVYFIMIGIIIGFFATKYLIETKIEEAILLQRGIFKGQIYDINKNITIVMEAK